MSKAREIELKYGKDGFNKLFLIDSDNNLVWKVNRGGGARVGDVSCKSKDTSGYFIVTVDGVHLAAHRVIWIMRHGDIPDGMQVNHIDLCKTNNADSNHELVAHATNCRRRGPQKKSKTGYGGVHYRKDRDKWRVCTRNEKGERVNLGCYDDLDMANTVVTLYKITLEALFGEDFKYLC